MNLIMAKIQKFFCSKNFKINSKNIFHSNWILSKNNLSRGGLKCLLSKKSSEIFNIEKGIWNFYCRKRHLKKNRGRLIFLIEKTNNLGGLRFFLSKKLVLVAWKFSKEKISPLEAWNCSKEKISPLGVWNYFYRKKQSFVGPSVMTFVLSKKNQQSYWVLTFFYRKKPTVLWGSISPGGLKFF